MESLPKREVDKGHFFIDQINEEDYLNKDFDNEDGMSTNYRQYLQNSKIKREMTKSSYYHPYLKDVNLSEFEKRFTTLLILKLALWHYPFTKIDTHMNRWHFNHSYHILDGDKIEHKGEIFKHKS